MDEEMKALVSRLTEYLKEGFEQQLRCFFKHKSLLEGWFKGELFYFLEQERLPNFEPEKSGDDESSKRIDIVLPFDNSGGSKSWVELKHWNTYWGRCWYFNNYIKPDVEKLLKMRKDGDKFILVLCTKNPGPKEWNAGVNQLIPNFPPLAVRSLTNPGDYPDYFFLGLLHVCPKVASIDVPREGA